MDEPLSAWMVNVSRSMCCLAMVSARSFSASAADSRSAISPAVVGCGEVSGGAGEVVREHGADQPGGVGGELPAGQVGQGPVDEVGVDLFDDGVAAVLGFGGLGPQRAVGEHGVVAPGGEQFAPTVTLLGVEAPYPPHDEPGGDL